MRSYLDFVGHGLRRQSIGIEQLSQASLLDRFHAQAERDASILRDILGELPPRDRDSDSDSAEGSLFEAAVRTAERVGLELVASAESVRGKAPQDLVESLFSNIWSALRALGAGHCELSTESESRLALSAPIEPERAGEVAVLFNPFGAGSTAESLEAGGRLLAAFIISYHLGWSVSGSALSGGMFELFIELSGTPETQSLTGLDAVLMNETLWERVLDGANSNGKQPD